MVDPTPEWTIERGRAPITLWYGHVHLLPKHALGQWFCVDRATGRVLWDRRHPRANTFVGCDSGVIVADEMRSDGPWTASFGCYGLSLASGELLWASHGEALWGRALRALDFLPGYTNELRDTPAFVSYGECVCASGRVLDVRTGRMTRRISRDEANEAAVSRRLLRSDAEQLYRDGSLQVSADGRLSIAREGRYRDSDFGLGMSDASGNVIWQFSIASLGYVMSHRNFYAYRYAAPNLFLIVSESRNTRPHPTTPHSILPRPTIFHLLVIDLRSGTSVQDIRLNAGPVADCRIEDVDDRSMLVSLSGRELRSYRRVR